MSTLSETQEERGLARLAQRSAAWTEKWFPDAYVFALAGVVLVSVAAMANGSSPATVAETFGGGFWDLATFTLQMAMVVLTGYVVATSPPVAPLRDFQSVGFTPDTTTRMRISPAPGSGVGRSSSSSTDGSPGRV